MVGGEELGENSGKGGQEEEDKEEESLKLAL